MQTQPNPAALMDLARTLAREDADRAARIVQPQRPPLLDRLRQLITRRA